MGSMNGAFDCYYCWCGYCYDTGQVYNIIGYIIPAIVGACFCNLSPLTNVIWLPVTYPLERFVSSCKGYKDDQIVLVMWEYFCYTVVISYSDIFRKDFAYE